MRYIVLVSCVLLAGCVHELPKTAAPKHHYVAKPAPKPAAVAPVQVPQAAPSPKQTFKQRWLRKFFRNRAEQ